MLCYPMTLEKMISALFCKSLKYDHWNAIITILYSQIQISNCI